MLIATIARMSMVEAKDKYLYKHQELIDALTDEMTELYSAQGILEPKLDRILAVISNEPDKVEEVNKHLLAYPRKNELEALSETIKSWTIRVENVSRELNDFEDFVDNDNWIIKVKDNLLIKLNESYNDL